MAKLKSLLVAGIIATSVSISTYPPLAQAQVCVKTGPDLIREIDQEIIPDALRFISQNPDPGREPVLQKWDSASAQIGGLCTCNALQTQYRTLSLELVTWQRRASICKYDFFLPGNVGGFLDCITPVNAGLIATTRARAAIQGDVQGAPCDVNPLTPEDLARIQTEVSTITQSLGRRLSRLSRTNLSRRLQRGVVVTLNPAAEGVVEIAVDGLRPRAVLVAIANGTAQSFVSLPVEVSLRLGPRGSKLLKSERTKRLRLTTTFTANDGTAISATHSFKLN